MKSKSVMEQFEKVCKGLECCVLRDPDDHRQCGECPYNPHSISNEPCANGLKHNALALIRQQQERIVKLEAAKTARVVPLEEIKDGESYWLSTDKDFVPRPVICVHREDDARKPYITFAWQFGTFSFELGDYDKTWHCWTAKPIDNQIGGSEVR